jgi:hypothetical protein
MSTFQASYSGIGEMLRSEFMQAAMRARAEKVLVLAIATAPVYEQGPHPGRYKAAFHVESGVQHHKTSRAYARVSNDAPEALYVEFGTRNNPAHHTLTKALDAARG